MRTVTRYWLDFEFMEDGTFILPLSLGMVCEDGREYYAEFDADLTLANEWVVANVLPHLSGEMKRKTDIANEVREFVDAGEHPPEFWGYYCDYDWVALCQLYGRMVDLPAHWPMFCLDVKQEAYMLGNVELPKQEGVEHNAIADARWNMKAGLYVEHLEELRSGIASARRVPLTPLDEGGS